MAGGGGPGRRRREWSTHRGDSSGGWMAGQSFPDYVCRLMAFDGVPNMHLRGYADK